jgi:site-specific DNA-methyltransferase (adenine-specific)
MKNNQEAKNLLSILKSKLYDYCLKKSKFSGFFHVNVLKNIPKLDLSRSWTDQDIYEYFNLTQEEIDLIESSIK